jgi:hypothetical protein
MPEFIQRYLRKSRPEDITIKDVRQFISQDVEEHLNLEYKPRGLWVDKQDHVLSPKDPRDLVGYSALARTVAGFQWETSVDRVVYPDFSADIGSIDFSPNGSSTEALELDIELYAEGMSHRDLRLRPSRRAGAVQDMPAADIARRSSNQPRKASSLFLGCHKSTAFGGAGRNMRRRVECLPKYGISITIPLQ